MRDSIWTRQRKLHQQEQAILKDLRQTFKDLSVELDNDDWRAAATSARSVADLCDELTPITIEIEDVDWIVASFDRINERMEKLDQIVADLEVSCE